jgi:sugar-specific transcriptional regulator TrmB
MLEKELQEIGLNEKEAKVYLASLELGQSVVQDIAKKAGLNRPTAYFIIDNLMKRGLMSSFHQGKKQFFVAADPDKLIDIASQEKQRIEKREGILKKLLPQLQSINNKITNKPVVRYYEGKEGLITVTEEFLKSAGDVSYMVYSVDKVNNLLSKEEKGSLRSKRLAKGIKTEVIYTYENGVLQSSDDGARLKIPHDKFPISCDIAIYGDKVRIASLEDKLVGIIIEDKNIAETLKSIFKLAQEAAEKYN